MSALAKPLNHFSGAIASPVQPVVAAEHCIGIEKKDEDTMNMSTGAKATEYLIIFHMNKIFSEPIRVKFATSAARNTSYTNYIAANSAVIA